MTQLSAISHLSPVADPLFARLLDGVTSRTPINVRLLSRIMVPPMLGLGTSIAEIGWVCGSLHINRLREGGWPYEVLAAPVMAPQRYDRQPVYFGDVVVSKAHPATTLDEALDGVFVMNEPESLSGYKMLLAELRESGRADRLRDVTISGSHLGSLREVADRDDMFATIDSTVLDMLRARQHPILTEIDVIGSLGPYPAPPIVVRSDVPLELRDELLQGIKAFAASVPGRKLLYSWNVADIVQVDAAMYNDLF